MRRRGTERRTAGKTRARVSRATRETVVRVVRVVRVVCVFVRSRIRAFVFIGRGCDPGNDDRSSVDGRVVAFEKEKRREKSRLTRGASNALGGRGGTPRRGRSEGRDALFVCVFACGVASRSRGRRGCARGVSRTSPRGPRSHREADPFGHGNSVPLAPSPRAEVTRTRGPRPRRPPKPHARHPPAADGTDGQPPQPPSSRVVSSAPASDSAPPVKKTKKFRAVMTENRVADAFISSPRSSAPSFASKGDDRFFQ